MTAIDEHFLRITGLDYHQLSSLYFCVSSVIRLVSLVWVELSSNVLFGC